MEGTSSESIKERQQNFYRKYFRRMIFGFPLSHNFHDQLEIPRTLVQYLEEGRKLPDNVSLAGPGGATWKVRISSVDGTLLFNEGWKDFVEDHQLEEDDILVFEYSMCTSRFDVLTIIDHTTRFEKVGSLFVGLSDGTQANDNNKARRRRKMKGPIAVGVGANPLPDKNRAHQGSRRRIRENVEISGNFTHDEEFILPLSEAGKRREGKRRGRPRAIDIQNNIALRRARAEEIVGTSKVLVIRKNHVDCSPFRVRLSLVWLKMHLSEQSLRARKVLLSMDMQMHPIILHLNEIYKYAELAAGWKQFACRYSLKVSDVCLFKPAGINGDGIPVINVKIFHNRSAGQNC